MKTKISKFLGVGLALIMVFSLAFALVPAKTEAAPAQWTPETGPGQGPNTVRVGSDVTDFAVASDGMTIYALDATGDTLQARITATGLLGWAGASTYNITYRNQAGGLVGSQNFGFAATDPVGTIVPIGLNLVIPDTGCFDATGFTVVLSSTGLATDVFQVVGVNSGTVYATCTDAVAGAYAVPPQYTDGAEFQGILKSPNGGRTFSPLASPTAAAGFVGPARLVAVSPDNPNVMAFVDSAPADVPNAFAAGQVFASKDGGVNWIQLPGVPGGAATNVTMSIAVGPSRATAAILDGRDVLVCTADTAATFLNTDVSIIGQTLAWTPISAAGVTATYDFTSAAFTPGFLGDRVIAAVGSNATGTNLLLVNLGAAWGNGAFTAQPGAAVVIQAEPLGFAGAPSAIVTSDIALPSNFDPTTPAGQRTFVAITAAGAVTPPLGADVFRVDFLTTRKLGIAADININSISYSGDLTGGTLLVGATTLTGGPNHIQTWFTVDPMAAFPTFIGSSKPPTGESNAIVACAPDFPTSGHVFAGSTDTGANNESAFSLSYDGGTSFNQISLIDTTLAGMSDVMVTPAGDELFLATWCATAPGLESLWKSPVMATAGGWDRVRISPMSWGDAPGATIIRLNPGYADAPVVYWANRGAVNIQYSNDGGAVFAPRDTIPAAITDIAVEDENTLYGACGTVVYRSDSAAWNFAVGPVTAGIGPINMIAMAPTYPLEPVPGHLLVGGAGAAVAYSTNGAESFAPPIGTGLVGTNFQVVGDTDYATNNTIYAARGTAAAPAGIFRFVIGTSSIWTRIATLATLDPAVALSPGTVFGMVATNGALYAGWNDTAGAGAFLSGAERSLNPTSAVGILAFDRMDVGSTTSVFDATPQSLRIDGTTSPTLYAIDTGGAGGAGLLMSYLDLLATVSTTINNPAAGATIAIDPVTGRAMPVTLNWAPMGFSTGLVTTYQVMLFEESQGPAGAEGYFVTLGGGAINNPTIDIVPVAQAVALGVGVPGGDIAYTFVGGTSYGIMIRAWNEVSTDQIRSNFCAPVFIDIEASSGVITPTHAGPELTSPIPGTQDIDPGTGFSWNPMAGVTEYELIIATDSGLTSPVAGTPVYLDTTSYGPVELEYAADYYYAVKATEPTSSVQTVGHFRTMDEPVEKYTCEYCGLTFDTRAELEAHIAAAHAPTTPLYIWIVIAIGAILVIAVIWLIFTTRRA